MTDKEFLKQLGLRLKCQRIMVELTTKQVADKTGLNPTTINKIENGSTDFHILILNRIATVYGMSIKELL